MAKIDDIQAQVEMMKTQLERLEVKIDGKLPLNLDGEPERWDHVLFEVEPRVLPLVLPADCPLISAEIE